MLEKLPKDILLKRMKDITENYNIILENVNRAKSLSHVKITDDVKILAATKTVNTQLIEHSVNLGIKYIGENRVQEFIEKFEDTNRLNVEQHFIGNLQTNKVKYIFDKVAMIHSVSSIELAKEINKRCAAKNIVANILLEINIGQEESKSGFSLDSVLPITDIIDEMPAIKLCGVMAIPPIFENKADAQRTFYNVAKLLFDIRSKKRDNSSICYLSMGMSADYFEAILEGANIVRIGSALYGKRD